MGEIRWNSDKNIVLKQIRGVCFEDVQLQITTGNIIDIIDHPNQDKYPNQRLFILEINSYLYQVPFVEDEKGVFLKTIIPNRKLKRKYDNNH